MAIPKGAVTDTHTELMIFNGNDDARKFFYFYENVVKKGLPDKKTWKIVAYLAGRAFDFYFDRFTMDNGPTDEAKDCGKVKRVMLEKYSVRKTESEIMKGAKSLEYDGGDIQTSLTRADKLYSQAKFNDQAKFGLLRDSLKSDQMLLQFVLFRGAKNYDEIKQACVEYSDNRKMMDGPITNNERKGVRFTVQSEPKDSRIDDLRKKVENLHLMVTKQHRSARQSEPVCYNCNKKGQYASQCHSLQEPTCYRCNKKGHHAIECPINPDPLVSCTYCHRKGHKA